MTPNHKAIWITILSIEVVCLFFAISFYPTNGGVSILFLFPMICFPIAISHIHDKIHPSLIPQSSEPNFDVNMDYYFGGFSPWRATGFGFVYNELNQVNRRLDSLESAYIKHNR